MRVVVLLFALFSLCVLPPPVEPGSQMIHLVRQTRIAASQFDDRRSSRLTFNLSRKQSTAFFKYLLPVVFGRLDGTAYDFRASSPIAVNSPGGKL